jgi:hypothetical protein
LVAGYDGFCTGVHLQHALLIRATFGGVLSLSAKALSAHASQLDQYQIEFFRVGKKDGTAPIPQDLDLRKAAHRSHSNASGRTLGSLGLISNFEVNEYR